MDSAQLKETRNFLMLYHTISQSCFNRCVVNLQQRTVKPSEESCVDACTTKFMNVNHATMLIYAELMPHYLQKRIEQSQEQEKAMTEMLAKIEAESTGT